MTNLTANTKNAYWDLLAAIRAIDAAKQSLALAEKLVEDNRVRVEVGTLAPMDIIPAQAEAATRRQTLTQAEATRRTAELVLKRLIVSETDDPIWSATIDPTDMVQVQPTHDQPRVGGHDRARPADRPADGQEEPGEQRHQHPVPAQPDDAGPERHCHARHARPRRQPVHPRERRRRRRRSPAAGPTRSP